MHRTLSLAASLALAFAASQALAAEGDKAKPAKPAAKAPAAAPAPAVEYATLTPAQLEIAPRVYVGRAECEFSQSVNVSAIEGKPGYFKVTFGKATYTMAPYETSTGAVRLEDHQSNTVWLQIPSKSMLMDTKLGRRLVDSCMHAEQRMAVAAK